VAQSSRPIGSDLLKGGKKGGRSPRHRRALALQHVVKGPSSTNIIMASLLLSKLDNQLGISTGWGCELQ
jgi:hypothetical protein